MVELWHAVRLTEVKFQRPRALHDKRYESVVKALFFNRMKPSAA